LGADAATRTIEDAKKNLFDNVKDERLRTILWPDYKPWGRRVTLHEVFYKSLVEPNVEVVQDRIVTINKAGIITAAQDAKELVIVESAPQTQRDFDIIICG
jgi:cation diffusion facilitator CzcD-associated flavoprotein CzcO